MAWLRRSGGGAPVAPADGHEGHAAPIEIEHSARGLVQVLERLPRPRPWVLDLGPALARNIDFFNQFGARLRIADLERSLREADLWHADGEPTRWERDARSLLAIGEGESYHLILAWDLPNYLGRQRWPALASLLVERLAPGGMLHLLVRTARDMPARPSRYRWLGADRLREEVCGSATIAAPRLSHGEIERLHRGLAAAHSFLSKLGLQEFVLEHAEELNIRPLPQARLRPPRRR